MRSRPPIIERVYQADEAACVRALELLLKRPVSKEGAAASAPDDARGESHGSHAEAKSSG